MASPAGRDMTAMFLNELKAKYTSLCYEFHPVQFAGSRGFSIDDVFVGDESEYFDGSTSAAVLGNSWQSLESYMSCFTRIHVRPTQRIIEGAPGFGKSTLTLKLASDWCRGGPDSPLRDVEILILLRLRQLRGVRSFYAAIKRLLLSSECSLSEADIKSILGGAASVAILLDDYDEYIKHDDNVGSDIERIVTRQMFKNADVTITVRHIPNDLPERMERVRLSGFDDWSRDQYIDKVVGSDNTISLEMKRYAFQNAILSGLMDVPAIFATLVHVAERYSEYPTFQFVTDFLRYVIERFQDSDPGRCGKARDVTEPGAEGHSKLKELAFEDVMKGNEYAWDGDNIRERLGHETYDHYVSSGILVAAEVFVDSVDGLVAANSCDVPRARVVKFHHGVFRDWYASLRVAEVVSGGSKAEVWGCLQKIDPGEFPYVYRFACGQGPTAGGSIVDYLNGNRDCGKLAVLCMLEQPGTVDGARVKIGQLFSGETRLWSSSSRLAQRSTIELMGIAARHDIKISNLDIVDCNPRVGRSGSRLLLVSGLSLPALETLQCLVINQNGLLSTNELLGILTFSSWCTGLKKLTFLGCRLPKVVPSAQAMSRLRLRKVEVLCDQQGVGIRTDYQYLNFNDGQWEVIRERRVRKAKEARAKSEQSNNNAGELPGGKDGDPEQGGGSEKCTIA